MTIRQLWKNIRYRPHDCRGNAKCLLARIPTEHLFRIEGISKQNCDDALRIICRSFDIPERQMYCLRCDDELLTIYRGMNGPRDFDQFQFERLWIELQKIPSPKVSAEEFETIKSVADVIHTVAARQRT